MCGSHRNFNMNIFGPDNNVMVAMNRPFTCQSPISEASSS